MTQPNRIGWYTNPDNPDTDRYWNGRDWDLATRRHRAGAWADFDPDAPTLPPTVERPKASSGALYDWGIALWVLAVLAGAGGVIFGVVLMVHSHQVGAGGGVVAAGVVQFAVLATVAQLSIIVHGLRERERDAAS